nr:phosphotransferase [Bacteroidales bacterium]
HFNDSLKSASSERLKKADDLIRFSTKHADSNLELFDFSEKGDVPVRLTHCDTKFNNILYGPDGNATCMIDLDTVMRGFAWFDFGDALRTCASIAPEDEEDVKKIGFRIEIFEGFAKGYIKGAAEFLTKDEISILHRAPIYFTYMQGLRFLTDYLNKDVYYKTAFPEHNFQRARAQFTLMERMLEQQSNMAEIISKAVAEV